MILIKTVTSGFARDRFVYSLWGAVAKCNSPYVLIRCGKRSS